MKLKNLYLIAGLLTFGLALSLFSVLAAPTLPMVDDFETPLNSGQDSNGNNIGVVTWGDTANTTVTQTTVSSSDPMARPGQAATNKILKIDYEIGSYGGLTHAFENATVNQWVTQDWTSYKGLSFWLYGANTGKQIQVEIFDNRSPDAPNSTVDSAERFFYRVDDNYTGWKKFEIPFTDFNRRADWQPTGAPEDGFGKDKIHGYAFSFPAGTGPKTNYLDEVMLYGGTVVPPTGTMMVDDFEANNRLGQDSNGNNVGMVTWGDTANTTLTQTTVASNDPMARPGQAATNRILKIDYEIGSYGGLTHAFENEAANQWVTQNWTSYKGLSFWFYGANTAGQVQVEIFDNRGAGSTTDSAERYYYRITDDFTGWKKFEIPFTEFKRRTDWQPTGAPEDGLGLNEVNGYAFGFPSGTGPKTNYLDEVMVYGATAASDETIIDDFEVYNEVFPGIENWGSADKPTLVQVDPPSPLPGQTTATKVMSVTYNVAAGGWGGFTHAFTQSQDWSSYEGFSFWFYGMNTGTKDLRIEIKDGGPGVTGEGNAEIFAFYFTDDFNGWKQFKLAWADMPRRTDYNPGPDDGLSLKEMWGYALGTDGGSVNKVGSYYLENVALYGKSGGNPTPTPTPAPQTSVSLGKAMYRVSEGSSVTVSVTLDTTATESVSVDYMGTAETATAGQDYNAITGTLTFNAGDPMGTVKTFMVEALTDSTGEVAESLTVMLVNPVKASLGKVNTAKVIINANGLPYLNPALPVEQRVQDLLGRMTIKEKVGQMTQIQHQSLESKPSVISDFYLGSLLSGGGGAPKSGNNPIDWANMYNRYQEYALSTRLQIPLIYGIDAVHGNNNVYGSTVFPHNIGLGATRNPALAEKIGQVTAQEVAALGIDWTFSPCICVSRDERWGRSYESFGEDPEIASMMTTIIDGYQGKKLSDPDSVLATAKHFVGDGGTTNGQNEGNTEMDEETLRMIHIAPFTDAIKRNVGTIMPSYSSWNGTKMHGHKYLLQDVLKDQMGFKGFLISDWAGIDQIPGDYNSDVRTSINAGLDMVMVPGDHVKFTEALLKEYVDGNVPLSRIDDAVSRILMIKFEMGLFERPFGDLASLDKIGSPEHREVARQAVRESLVLLKNDGKILPLPKTGKTILVAGKNADDLGHQQGGWSITWQGGSGNTNIGTTILQGIKQVAPNATVTFNKEATGTLTGDVGIVVVGEKPYAEGAGDAKTADKLSLSAEDKTAITNVCNAMPCVVVLVSGRPLLINDELAQSKAFVAAWLPGTEGAGVADVLFGDAAFTGKLPVTWPKSFDQLPINKGDGKEGLFAYGYGMTYQSDTVVPTAGVTDMNLGAGVLFTAPAGTFPVEVTLRYTSHGPINTGAWRHIGVFYSIEAVDGSGNVVTPTGKYTIKVSYDGASLPSSIDESMLALYYRDASGNWVKEASSVVDMANDMVTANTDHFSEWAILAAATSTGGKTHLPIIIKQ